MDTIQITPKRAPIQRKTTAFPLLDGISEGHIHFVLWALRSNGLAAWVELSGDAMLVTEATLEQLAVHCGSLNFLK